MYIIIAILLLVIVNLCILVFFNRHLKHHLSEILRALLYGMITALIIKGFVYGIGRQMNIDFYFFEIRILGKNALANFEEMYGRFVENFSVQYSIIYTIGTIILPATLEEIGKLLSLRMVTIKNTGWSVSTIREYVYRMFIVALGFSFLENLFYLGYYLELGHSGVELVQLIFLRIIMSTSSHLLFSGIAAYFYARFMFGKYDLVDTGGFTSHKKIVSFLKRIHLFYSPLFSFAYSSRLFFVGLSLAIGGHILYNLLIFTQYNFMALIFLFFAWLGFIFIVLRSDFLDKNLGIIQQKISLMKELRRLQKQKDELFGEGEK